MKPLLTPYEAGAAVAPPEPTPRGVCQRAGTPQPCAWPRCACRVDIVYSTKIKIPRR